ncbi:uncharacterized protein mars isoform X2 [Bemisia tabaci]|uniref:uncharacterized protein mars isoform X2 n=1 Tax=Bemisia tabaci TaxID=7038 RepID=UPI003B28D802
MSQTFRSAIYRKSKHPHTLRSASDKDLSRRVEAKKKREKQHVQFRNMQLPPDEPVIAEAEKLALETKAADDRIQGLLKWKEERKRKLDAEKNQKKPAFKVGVVTHNIGSPYFKVYDDSKKTHNPVRKHQFQFRSLNAKVMRPLTIPVPPKFAELKTHHCKTHNSSVNKRVLRSNTIKENVMPVVEETVKVLRTKKVDPNQVRDLKMKTDKILTGKKKTPSPGSANVLNDIGNVSQPQPPAKDLIFSPISPNVCLTRGKRRPSTRSSDGETDDSEKKQKKKLERARNRIALSHLTRLDFETQRLHDFCEKWNNIGKSESPSEEIASEINALSGKTRLLTSDKFMQFRRLVEQFDTGTANPPIMPEDLTGFWDMVYLQVEDLEKKFNNLEKLRSNKWKSAAVDNPVCQVRKSARPPCKIVKKAAASSTLKKFIADARKNKEQSTLPKEEFKTFDGGHFKIASPLIQTHVPRRKSDANNSLLRQVMSSGSKRITPKLSVNASLNAVRKSVLARTISSSPAIVVNQTEETPKSILRKSPKFASVTTPTTTAKKRQTKSLRFGPPMFQSPDSTSHGTPMSDSSVPATKRSNKIRGTPYKKASLDETFSMDEDDSPEVPKIEVIQTPLRRSLRKQQKENNNCCWRCTMHVK